MRLIEFKPSESTLYEAFSVLFFGADNPDPSQNEVKPSIKAEEAVTRHGVETKDSEYKLEMCPFCRQRMSQNPRIYTLPGGQGADIIVDDKVFDYIYSRLGKYRGLPDVKLKRAWAELEDRLNAVKSSELDDDSKITKYLHNRDNPKTDSKSADTAR